MGEYAEERLRSLYPEAFGGEMFGRRYRNTGPRPQQLPVVRVGVWRFVGWTSGVIHAFAKGERLDSGGQRITRQPGSHAFLKGYPRKLTAEPGLTVEGVEELGAYWLRWKGLL